jgi:hypothetical protein
MRKDDLKTISKDKLINLLKQLPENVSFYCSGVSKNLGILKDNSNYIGYIEFGDETLNLQDDDSIFRKSDREIKDKILDIFQTIKSEDIHIERTTIQINIEILSEDNFNTNNYKNVIKIINFFKSSNISVSSSFRENTCGKNNCRDCDKYSLFIQIGENNEH